MKRIPHYESNKGREVKATKEYYTWNCIKQRCYYKNRWNYKYYGGKGIKVCKRWIKSYKVFLKDMGRSPSKSHTIDRLNHNGDYKPSNCRWATKAEQVQNREYSKVNKFIVLYIRLREAKPKIILNEINNICSASTLYNIKIGRTWNNI